MIDITDLLSEDEIEELKNRIKECVIKDISDYIRQIVASDISSQVREELQKIDIKQLVKDTVTDSVNMKALGLALYETQRLLRDKVSEQASAIIKACFNFEE